MSSALSSGDAERQHRVAGAQHRRARHLVAVAAERHDQPELDRARQQLGVGTGAEALAQLGSSTTSGCLGRPRREQRVGEAQDVLGRAVRARRAGA